MSKQIDASNKAVHSAIIGNFIITIFKFVGFGLTGSPSMLAESLHSLADVANQLFLLIGLNQSRSGPCPEYNFGTGTARYLWNFISAVGIFFIGCSISVFHGIKSLIYPAPPKGTFELVIILGILFGSFLVELYSLMVASTGILEKKGSQSFIDYIKTGDDPTIVAVFLEDLAATTGIIIAASGIILSHVYNTPIPDSLSAIVIGLILGFIAIFLGKKNAKFLIGVAVSKEDEEKIKEFIEKMPSVEKVVKMRTEVLAPKRIHLSLEIEFHGAFFIDKEQIEKDIENIRSGDPIAPILVDNTERTIRVLGRVINQIERSIKEKFPDVVSIDLEVN